MKQKRAVIVGIGGRMGEEISALAPAFGFKVVGGVSRHVANRADGVRIVPRISLLEPGHCDLVIDFSLPEATPSVLDWCRKNRKCLISGVTGIDEAQLHALQAAADEIPVLWSPNMSLGIAVLARALRELRHLPEFDFQIEETHHQHKKDRPSGTALFLQTKLESALGHELPPPLAIRGGGVFGIHRLFALGEDETLTFEHTALNRRVFARGTLKAADWLLTRPPGFYNIDDVLAGS